MKNRFVLLLLLAGLAASSGAPAEAVPELYVQRCAVCHLPGIAGAPKVGDSAEWTRRVRPGLNAVYRNALEGMPNTAMMAKGGHDDLKDEAIRAIVDYMISAARVAPDALRSAARYDALDISNRDFIRLDTNFDGFLSRDEVAQDGALARTYARFDANRDGRLSASEYQEAEAALERERMAVRVDDGALIAAVRAAIAKVKGVDIDNTKVEAAGGVVAMIGMVEDAETARRAYDAVKRIPGIQKIENRLISGHQIGWD